MLFTSLRQVLSSSQNELIEHAQTQTHETLKTKQIIRGRDMCRSIADSFAASVILPSKITTDNIMHTNITMSFDDVLRNSVTASQINVFNADY